MAAPRPAFWPVPLPWAGPLAAAEPDRWLKATVIDGRAGQTHRADPEGQAAHPAQPVLAGGDREAQVIPPHGHSSWERA